MRRIKILSRDVWLGNDYVLGRCEYGNDRPAKTTKDGDQLARCGHLAFFGMKLLKTNKDRQRKSFLRLAHICGNMVDELNNNNVIKGFGSLVDSDVAVAQTKLDRARGIKDKQKKHG